MVRVGPYRNSTNRQKKAMMAARPRMPRVIEVWPPPPTPSHEGRGRVMVGHSSFLMSTMRRIAAIISSTTANSTTALAQAAGYCSSDIWLAIIRPTEAL